MSTKKIMGDMGEALAQKYLKRRFWRIVSTNYKALCGEIDIIGYRFGVLVFFEVKTRSNQSYGTPASAVDNKKIKNIKTAGNSFLATYCSGNKLPKYRLNGEIKYKPIRKKRIDVIEIYASENNRINHIKDFNNGEEL